jgi:DNA recombination protein RmuC
MDLFAFRASVCAVMETGLLIAVLAVVGLAALGVLVLVLRGERAGGRLDEVVTGTRAAQEQMAERLAAQERVLRELLEGRLAAMQKHMADGMLKSTDRTVATMTDIQKRLAVIDEAQKNISQLSTQMVGLQDILSNKQARGAFGEVQLQDIVTAVLPPSAFEFQAVLSNGRRADCLLKLPNPPGSIVIDSKFPLESFQALANAPDDAAKKVAGRAFVTDVMKHVTDISEKYILVGETAESALMFLPSEAVYAELHANFREAVEKSYRARVWIVSPTTLWATLNTVRAVLKDVRMREQAHVIQKEVGILAEDVKRLDERVASLKRHFGQAEADIGQIETSAGKITSRTDRIGAIEMEDGDAALPSPAPGEKPRLVQGGGE